MNRKIIINVTDKIIATKTTDWAMDMECFDWVPAVGLYGVMQAYKKTGEPKYLAYIKDWFSRHLSEAYSKKTVNSIAPLLTLAELYQLEPNVNHLKVMKDMADFIVNEAPKTVDGGLEHTVTEPVPGFSEQIWADTLFMVCIFMVKLGRLVSCKAYADFAVEQTLIHHRLLSDGQGMYFHGYNGFNKDHMSAVRWARANAWIIYASAEILSEVGEFPQRKILADYIKAHSAALEKVQAPCGGFHTILNDPTSYIEISATAGISAGIEKAVKEGFVDPKYLSISWRAMECVKKSVAADGSVLGVSTGTPVMPTAQHYKNIAIVPTLYGQGLAILAI